MKLSVIIPCFNEEDVLHDFRKELEVVVEEIKEK